MGRIALGFNPVYPVEVLVKFAKIAEAKGYESVWMHESLFQRDAITYLSSILSATNKIRAGSGCINTVTRHPTLAAASFATLSESSVGRAILGVGLGSFPMLPKIGFQVFPTSKSKPLKRIREYATILRSYLNGETVNFSGEFFSVNGLRLEVKPQHKIPIYIASLSQNIIQATPAMADGVILSPALSTVKETETKVRWIEDNPAVTTDFDIASYMLTSVQDNQEEAEKTVRNFYFFVYQVAEVIPISRLEPYGINEEKMAPVKEAWKKGDVPSAGSKIPREVIDALTLTGTPRHCMGRLEEYCMAGIKLPILMPIGDIARTVEALAPN
ncbi:MAG: LLM class flavin-dependent oxidoreductase [Thaumarchaeota archaeon]|nr:LLM class flavin-dependent oxidoreductase [Nitrososphaerota archaeon]